ncbi:hypothetical protein GCM10010317_088330 [Streptomyces mirabilis]|uniref:MmyB family transcriptional regulator n=1 Tax=Streptomyces mirabilis TaxID=68239 RepID=UPI00167D9CC5|nr:hypothetical protein [Streptomyces mirabilis]GHD74763.1 hypothetical protein GCM10010317_088330 [Streptomyces mirabilis]
MPRSGTAPGEEGQNLPASAGRASQHHPLVGDLTLGFEAFTPIGDPDQTLGLYTVEPGSPSENALCMLASWTADNTHIQPEKAAGHEH